MIEKLFLKISRKLVVIKKDFIIDITNFSYKLALVRFTNHITSNFSILKYINKWGVKKQHEIILKYLEKKYNYVLNEYKDKKDCSLNVEKSPIWVCWLQGETLAPELVKNCIKSIRRNANNHEVILITLENYKNYIDIPNYIIEKFELGEIKPAHFSDIIRMMLLRDYGGLWLDSTVYCKDNIPEYIFEIPIFSCKSPRQKTNYVSEFQWTSFILGGNKNNLFYKFMCDFYLEYWKKEKYSIDYLLIDYIIVLACNNIPSINKMINNIPVNNLDRDKLAKMFYEEFDIEKYNEFINSETYFYKLSWRENFPEILNNNEKTFYYNFLNSYNEYFNS